jgi:hypothetical protein
MFCEKVSSGYIRTTSEAENTSKTNNHEENRGRFYGIQTTIPQKPAQMILIINAQSGFCIVWHNVLSVGVWPIRSSFIQSVWVREYIAGNNRDWIIFGI